MSSKLVVLDRSMPFGEVVGLPGAAFEQGAVFFNAAGVAVKEKQLSPIDNTEEVDVQDGDENIHPAEVTISPPKEESSSEFGTQSEKELKILVEIYGGTWTNKEEALLFLNAKG